MTITSAWFRSGTVSVTSGNKYVQGFSTAWVNHLTPIGVGDAFTTDFQTLYEVVEVVSDTQIKLDRAYEGVSASKVPYGIIRNGSSNFSVRTASAVQKSLAWYQQQLGTMEKLLTEDGDVVVELPDGTELTLWSEAKKQAQWDAKLAGFDAMQSQKASGFDQMQVNAEAEHNSAQSQRESEFNETLAKYDDLMTEVVGSAIPEQLFRDQQEQNKSKYRASGFVEPGKHYSLGDVVNEGMTAWTDSFSSDPSDKYFLGRAELADNAGGTSNTEMPMVVIDGVEFDLYGVATTSPTTRPNIIKHPPASKGTKTFDGTEVRKYDTSAGIGVEYDTSTVNFDGETCIKLPPHAMKAGSKVSFKFILDQDTPYYSYLLDTAEPRAYVFVRGSADERKLYWQRYNNIKVNGETVTNNSLTVQLGVEYHFEAELDTDNVIELIGSRYSLARNEYWKGQLWDIKLEDPTALVPMIHYKNLNHHKRAEGSPSTNLVENINGDPTLKDGWAVNYDEDGFVTIPEFPLADNMQISVVLRLDDISVDRVFGYADESTHRLYFRYAKSSNNFHMYVGNRDFSFPVGAMLELRTSLLNINISKNAAPADNYTVTVQLDDVSLTYDAVTFTQKSWKNFQLGSTTTVSSAYRWKGLIQDFKIDYPDLPDMNRHYVGIETTNPEGSLTLSDALGFTDKSWRPAWYTNHQGGRFKAHEWHPSSTDWVIECIVATDDSTNAQMTFGWKSDYVQSSNFDTWGFYFIGDNAGKQLYIKFGCQNPNDQNSLSAISLASFVPSIDVRDNREHQLKLVSDSETGTIKFYIDGRYEADIPYQAVRVPFISTIGARGTGSNTFYRGTMRDVRLVDVKNPANSRHFPVVVDSATEPTVKTLADSLYNKDTSPLYTPAFTGSASRHVTIPEWKPASASNNKVRFKMRIDEVRSSGGIIGSSATDTTGHIWQDGSGTLSYNAIQDFKVDGVPYDNRAYKIQVGKEVEVEFTFASTVFGITHLMTLSYSLGYSSSGAIWDLAFIDGVDATNNRYYPGLVHSPAEVPTTTDFMGENLISNHFNDGVWSAQNGGNLGPSNTLTVTNAEATTSAAVYQSSRVWANDIPLVIEFTLDSLTIEKGARVILYREGAGDSTEYVLTKADIGTRVKIVSTGSSDFGSDNRIFFYINEVGVSFTVSDVRVYQDVTGTLHNMPWTLAKLESITDAELLDSHLYGWINDLPNYEGTLESFATPWVEYSRNKNATVLGLSQQESSFIPASQKAFDYAGRSVARVIIGRKDFSFIESWEEFVDERGLVAPYCSVQSGLTAVDGVPTIPVTQTSTQIGYCSFGEWDIETRGRFFDWNNLTVDQKLTVINNPKHRLFFDPKTKRLKQKRYRVRTPEGLGAAWENGTSLLPDSSANYLRYAKSPLGFVQAQGKSDVPIDFGRFDSAKAFVGHGKKQTAGRSILGQFNLEALNYGISESGDVQAVPLSLTDRLNQGCHHPAFNPLGCAEIWNNKGENSNSVWFSGLAKKPRSAADCFYDGDLYTSGDFTPPFMAYGWGSISRGINHAGRVAPYLYFDALYAGLIEDRRMLLLDDDTTKLQEVAARKAVRGVVRGRQKLPFTKFTALNLRVLTSGTSGSGVYLRFNREGETEPVKLKELFTQTEETRDIPRRQFQYVYNVTKQRFMYISCIQATALYVHTKPVTTAHYSDTGIDPFPIADISVGDVVHLVDCPTYLEADFDILPWVEQVGDPVELAKAFPEGAVGAWINQIPDGGTLKYKLNSKANSQAAIRLKSLNSGLTWSQDTANIDQDNNLIPSGWYLEGDIGLWFYPALSKFTEKAYNIKVKGKVGDVVGVMRSQVERGNRLMPSLTGAIGTHNDHCNIQVPMVQVAIDSDERLYQFTNTTANVHAPLNLPRPANQSSAAKALYTLIEKNGLSYLQFHGRVMQHDGTDWGDNNVVPIVNGEGVMTDDNGLEVGTFCHHTIMPLGIICNR